MTSFLLANVVALGVWFAIMRHQPGWWPWVLAGGFGIWIVTFLLGALFLQFRGVSVWDEWGD